MKLLSGVKWSLHPYLLWKAENMTGIVSIYDS